MGKEFTCSICGKSLPTLDEYLAHVAECGAKEKERIKLKQEQDRKRMELIDSEIRKINTARSYYDQCLNDFKAKYPKEYEENFGSEDCESDEKDGFVDLLRMFDLI